MPEWVTGKPLWIAVIILFCIVFLRAQATYWIARGLTEGGKRLTDTREGLTGIVARAVRSDRFQRAEGLVRRYGGPVISVSFLTVGLQTMILAAAGLLRMPWIRFTAWMIPGCVAWGFIYAVGGLAVWAALLTAAKAAPWAVALLLAGVAVVTWWLVDRRRRRSADPAAHTLP